VTRSRTIVIAGAGIGGLVLSLALARREFRATVLEQAERLDEVGAGIQLSPNASRVLIDLGLRPELEPVVVAPEAIRLRCGQTGEELARLPLGRTAEARYGAPYWLIHRGDLQSVLVKAARSRPDVTLRLATKVEDFAQHANGVTVHAQTRSGVWDERGIALVAADGLWSTVRARLGDRRKPRFSRRSAWRALVPADAVAPPHRQAATTVWFGRDAHLVHYPVRAGRMINIVAIIEDGWEGPGWGTPAPRSEIVARFSGWAAEVRALLAAPPEAWSRWALYDCGPLHRWGHGRVALMGDAAHPSLPFLAQGGAMAIEDAAVLAASLAKTPDDPAAGLRAYRRLRQPRTARIVRHARRNGQIYHLAGPAALARDLVMKLTGGEGLLKTHDWLYDWRPQ
jgi:salicylate hydroxylase